MGCHRTHVSTGHLLAYAEIEARIHSHPVRDARNLDVERVEALQAERASALLHTIIAVVDDESRWLQSSGYGLQGR